MGKKEKSDTGGVLVGPMGDGGKKGYNLCFFGGEPGKEHLLLEV